MYLYNDTNEDLQNFKAYYYIKGHNVTVVDDYTPNCSLYKNTIPSSALLLQYEDQIIQGFKSNGKVFKTE